MKIGYLTFGRDDFGYGLALCLNRIKNHEIYRVTPKTAKLVDVLLFSCFWWEHIYLLADFLRKANIKKVDSDRPRIIVGGFNTFNPIPFMAYADSVVCGDGEEILPSVILGEDPGLIWRSVSSLSGFCIMANNISRIEIARGCKFRCRFCAVAHLKPYREISLENLENLLIKTKTKRVSFFAPETTLYSKNEELDLICSKLKISREDSDTRLDQLSKRIDMKRTSVPRIGLEGLSERLRKKIGKPYSNEFIINVFKKLLLQKNRGIHVFIILDLPTEQESDWEEFAELLIAIGELPGAETFYIIPTPNMFLPTPHTPMEYEGIHWEKENKKKWILFFSKINRKWKVHTTERSRIWGPPMRILSMISTRGGEEFSQIEQEFFQKKIIKIFGGRVACRSLPDLLKALQKYGGPEKYCNPRSPEDDNPWKRLIIPHGK